MTHLSELIAELRKGDGNGCERSNWLMQEAADALMANQGAIVNSIIERTRTVEPQGEPSDAQDIIVQEVSRLAGLRLLRRYSGFSDHWWDELVGGIARVALRAAGGAR
ncbi:hypothetical protein [Microbacterium sp. p3-SID131]|uniref:hypothetical protein n=1 Tax=Microbacterium sp. p3-SID131 TaxID=2916215 RepID=UPI0021A5299A|nr:hypothetical protein [Microbacterium sp. p3-SID131]MCT1363329.1 hypothetical protein [Microbacterium sp. p3-SID131]